jgi:hypothetical protein
MASEVEEYLKATRLNGRGQDRQFSFSHIARYVCRDIYYSDQTFNSDFWERITERRGFSVGDHRVFKELIEEFIDED